MHRQSKILIMRTNQTAIYINDLIVNVISHDACCKLSYTCVSIFIYADDIILLSPSVGNLQLLLTHWNHELDCLDMPINTKKSYCIRIGHRFNKPCRYITTNTGNDIAWSTRANTYGCTFLLVVNLNVILTRLKLHIIVLSMVLWVK